MVKVVKILSLTPIPNCYATVSWSFEWLRLCGKVIYFIEKNFSSLIYFGQRL